MSVVKIKYLVLGAGISGLTFAEQKASKDILIIEKEERPGGLCRTFYKDGYIWDIAGHFFHFHSEETKKYVMNLMKDVEMKSATKCAKVFYNGHYMDAPFQYNIHQLSQDEFIECLTDLYFSEIKNIENFSEYVVSKYGNGIANKFLIPYNEKLYACKMDELDKNAMGQFLPKLDFRMLMNFYKGYKGATYNDSFLYPANGCGEIINALVSKIPSGKIQTKEEVISIDTKKKIVMSDHGVYEYEYLINSIPLHQFASMCGIKSIGFKYNKVLVLNMGFDLPAIDKNISWIYFPGDEFFYRVGFFSNIAGKEKLSIYVEIGYGSEEEVDLEQAKKRTLEDLKKVNIIDEHRLVSSMDYIISPAYVHLTESSKAVSRDIIDKFEKEDIYMLGRYGRWEYSAMDDSIEQAIALASEI